MNVARLNLLPSSSARIPDTDSLPHIRRMPRSSAGTKGTGSARVRMTLDRTFALDTRAPSPCPVCGGMPAVLMAESQPSMNRTWSVFCGLEGCTNADFATGKTCNGALANWNERRYS